MRKISLILVLLAACSLPLSAQTAAPGSSVSAGAQAPNGDVTITVTIGGLTPPALWRDIHFYPPRNAQLAKPTNPASGGVTVTPPPPPPPPAPPPGGPAPPPPPPATPTQSWKLKSSGTHIAVASTNSAAGFSQNGVYTFVLNFPTGGNTRSCNWELTHNGSTSKPRNGSILDRDGNGGAGDTADPGVDLPVANIGIHGDDSAWALMGAATDLLADGDSAHAGFTYQVFSSTSLSQDFGDPRGIGINDLTDPVPANWGMFSGDMGILDPDGSTSSSVEFVPTFDPALDGSTFYTVMTILDGAGDVLYATSPVPVTIALP